MDSTLALRISLDSGEKISDLDISALLNGSDLVAALTADFVEKPLYAIWHIIALAEIPYANSLDYTRKVVQYIDRYLATYSGFTLTGKETDLLPCYNAMLLGALSKLGYAQSPSVQHALEWIKMYQPFERNQPNSWTGKGAQKYGGCMQATPCFIGIAKTVKALIYYDQAVLGRDSDVKKLIDKGMDYILQHQLYLRLSDQKPIYKHILDLAFPASYQLNIVELLEMAFLTGNIHRSECKKAIGYVAGKKSKEGYWKINYIYKSDGYVSFDKRGQKAEWLSYLLQKYIS